MTAHEEFAWPDTLLIAHKDALRWAVPREFGGDELDPLDLHLRYEQISRESLPLALILSQRDSAINIIASSENGATRTKLLSEIQAGAFVTVGIAQLTTSRQGAEPALTIEHGQARGFIPWVTAAPKSKYIIAGATTSEGQILFALPSTAEGVVIHPPAPLVAMQSTLTCEVNCNNVPISDPLILAGPTPNVLSTRRKSVPLPQAFLALGHCRAAIDLIAKHDSDRARSLKRRFDQQFSGLHDAVLAACRSHVDPAAIPILRGRCNELALRITHAAVALYKGNALSLSHPAQRLAREALFLLVWSCPDPVIDCTIDLLGEGPAT